METLIIPYRSGDVPGVKRFNQRLKSSGDNHSFPESHISERFPDDGKSPIYQRFYIVKDNDGEVRGGYFFRHQEFYINKTDIELVDLQLPLSEGIIDQKYAHIGIQILQDAQERARYIFGLGMGGMQYPLPKLLKKSGWHLFTIPFYFYIVDPSAFLSDMTVIKDLVNSRFRKMVFVLTKKLKLLSLIMMLIRTYLALKNIFFQLSSPEIKVESLNKFESSADLLWEKYKSNYSIVAKRSSSVLNILYPPEDIRYKKLIISQKGVVIGWMVLVVKKMERDRFFGNIRVGTIVDSFSHPDKYKNIVSSATRFLRNEGVQLIITNNSNKKCGKHLKTNGYFRGPSNYILALSKKISELFENDIDFENSLFMRGDGDGPINLI